MKTIRAWAIKKRSHRGFIWRTDIRFYDPLKYALFRTRKDAWEYMKNRGLPILTHEPVVVFVEIREG
jgi:hypothetical protein